MIPNTNKLKFRNKLLSSKKPLWSSYKQKPENDTYNSDIEQVPASFVNVENIPVLETDSVVNDTPLNTKKPENKKQPPKVQQTIDEAVDSDVGISRQSMQRLAPKKTYERRKRNRRNSINTFFARFFAIVLLLAVSAGVIYVYALLNKKEAKDINAFYDFSKGRGYYVVLDSDKVNYSLPGENVSRRAFAKTKTDIVIEYYVFDTVENAQNAFEKVAYKRNIFQKAQLLLENSLHFPLQKESEETINSKGFLYYSRIGNTIFYISGREAYKDDILAISSAFKY